VYLVRQAPRTGVRLILIIAVGEVHVPSGRMNAYQLAEARARSIER
jgi:hypothetical protein